MIKLTKAVLVIASLGLVGTVMAEPITCSIDDVTVNGSDANECVQGEAGTSSAEEANALFPDGWLLGAKYNDGSGFESNSIGLGLFNLTPNDDGELVSGEFTIEGFYDPLLVAIKGGSQGSAFYYLFDPVNPTSTCVEDNAGNAICGTYANFALVGPQGGDQLQAISNVAWFVKEGTTRVSEPATLGLLGIGLLGIGFARRRRTDA